MVDFDQISIFSAPFNGGFWISVSVTLKFDRRSELSLNVPRCLLSVYRVLVKLVEECWHLQILMVSTLTCQIIVQQILLFFGEKNTYTTLLGPKPLLISKIFPSNPDFHLHK